jgi:hypothetical protein
MNNDDYNQHTIIKGKLYRYDPDFDAYFPVLPPPSRLEQWSWVIVTLVLTVLCFYVEYLR